MNEEAKSVAYLTTILELLKNQQTLKTYTTKEVAEILNLARTDKIDILRAEGALRGIKKGNGWIYPKFEVEQFLHDYLDLDISNRETIATSVQIVRNRKVKL